jgi:hypothetical protein
MPPRREPSPPERLRDKYGLAVALWLFYTVVAVAAGVAIYYFAERQGDSKTVHTETVTIPSELTPEPEELRGTPRGTASPTPTPISTQIEDTTEETTARPVLLIFAALAAGGWLIFPLKFAWDELAKNADDRRQMAGKMRDAVHTSINTHFGAMLYRQRSVANWADRCLEPSRSTNPPYLRLLYAVALLSDSFERLRDEGVVLLLRSISSEDTAATAASRLHDYTTQLLGPREDSDAQLVRAVRTDVPTNRRFVDFFLFSERTSGSDFQWGRLREITETFMANCRDTAKLTELKRRATAAYERLQAGLNDVYRDWYH